jgi:hypothetical protein
MIRDYVPVGLMQEFQSRNQKYGDKNYENFLLSQNVFFFERASNTVGIVSRLQQINTYFHCHNDKYKLLSFFKI